MRFATYCLISYCIWSVNSDICMRRVVLNVELESFARCPTVPTKLEAFPPKVSGTHNGGILYLLLGCFGGGKTPLHKPYPYSLLWVRIPPFSVPEFLDDVSCELGSPHCLRLKKKSCSIYNQKGPRLPIVMD